MKATLSLTLLGLGLMLGGCAATSAESSAAAEDTESDSAELVSGPGISLFAANDPSLKVNVKVADGVQASTQNKRFLKLTVSRGDRSFSSWCKGIAKIGADGTAQAIECYDSVSTVSDDDNEGFGITLRKKDGAYEIASVEYGGDGTFYGDRMTILQPSWHWVPHSPANIEHLALTETSGEGTSSDAFKMIESVGSRFSTLLDSDPIPNHQTRPLPAHSIEIQIFNTMETTTTLRLSQTGWTTATSDKVSVLKTPGKLSSGLASKTVIKNRVLENLL